MKTSRASCVLLMSMVLQFLPALVLAGGESLDLPEPLDKKVVLEGLSGFNLFIARTYNENLWLYAIICTVLMAAVGMAIALVTDIILKAFGMETTRIEHKE